MELYITQQHDTATATITGSFTFSDNMRFRSVFDLAIQKNIQHLVVDVSLMEFIDSAGLGMFLMLRDECNMLGKQLTLLNPFGQVKKVFIIAKFDELFHIGNPS